MADFKRKRLNSRGRSTPRDRPGDTIHLNDNQSADLQLEVQGKRQELCSGVTDQHTGPDSRQTLIHVSRNLNSVNSFVVSPAPFATGQPQKKGVSPVSVNLNKVQPFTWGV